MLSNRFERIYKIPVSVHLIIVKNDCVLLQKRINTGFSDGLYALPSGCVEEAESALDAVSREADEELGIEIASNEISHITTMHKAIDVKLNGWDSICFFCVVNSYKGGITNLEPDKCEELSFFPLDSLPENMAEFSRYGLEQALQRANFITYGF